MTNFNKMSSFQSGVVSYISNMITKSSELENLNKLFKKLDANNDGFLDKKEMK